MKQNHTNVIVPSHLPYLSFSRPFPPEELRTNDRELASVNVKRPPSRAGRNSPHRLKEQVRTHRPRTPSLYLSKKVHADPFGSPRACDKSANRQPRVTERYTLGQRDLSSSKQSANTNPVAGSTTRPPDPIQSNNATTPFLEGESENENVPRDRSIEQMHNSELPRRDDGTCISKSPFSELSATQSVRYAESLFSNATSLTSRTSCSPLYTTDRPHVAPSIHTAQITLHDPTQYTSVTSSVGSTRVRGSSRSWDIGSEPDVEKVIAPSSSIRRIPLQAGLVIADKRRTKYTDSHVSQTLTSKRPEPGYPPFSTGSSSFDRITTSKTNVKLMPPELAQLALHPPAKAKVTPNQCLDDNWRDPSSSTSLYLVSKRHQARPNLEEIVDEILSPAATHGGRGRLFSPHKKNHQSASDSPETSHLSTTYQCDRNTASLTSVPGPKPLLQRDAEAKIVKSRYSIGFWKRSNQSGNQKSNKTLTGVAHSSTSSNTISTTPRKASAQDHNDRATEPKVRTKKLPLFKPYKMPEVVPQSPSLDDFLAKRLQPIYLRSSPVNAPNGGERSVIANSISCGGGSASVSASASIKRERLICTSSPIAKDSSTAKVVPGEYQASGRIFSRKSGNKKLVSSSEDPATLTSVSSYTTGLQEMIGSASKSARTSWSLFPKDKQSQKTLKHQRGNLKPASPLVPSKAGDGVGLLKNTSQPQAERQSRISVAAILSKQRSQYEGPSTDTHINEPAESPVRRSSSFIRTSLDVFSRPRWANTNDPTRHSLDSNHHRPRCHQEATCESSGAPVDLNPRLAVTESRRPAVVNTLSSAYQTCPSGRPNSPPSLYDTRIIPNAQHSSSSLSINVTLDDKSLQSPSLVTKQAAAHLSKVIEEDFLSYSIQRSSVSSYDDIPQTFYFPIAPTSPPTIDLPRRPQSPGTFTSSTTARDTMSQAGSRVGFPAYQRKSTPVPIITFPRKSQTSPQGSMVPVDAGGARHVAIASTPQNPTKSRAPGRLSNNPRSVTRLQSDSVRGPSSSSWNVTTNALNADDVPISDLRFASLVTSKWLSFGRLLFSPCHIELKFRQNEKILVIDGLNTDWSQYCAMTYSNTTVHTLALESTSSMLLGPVSGAKAPLNHRVNFRSDIAADFPYPDNTFAATIVRFPVAATEATILRLISECTRVLRPGGYLETSIIDLDLLRMGTQARKSVRELKIRMHSANPSICLKPASDHIQQLLGHCGYEKLSRCIIGLPAVGSVGESRPSPLDEKPHNFGDLIRDESERGNKGIVNMISNVGQWWYSQCYERAVHTASIWEDEMLLRECKEQHTAFKLLVCYAQKPRAQN